MSVCSTYKPVISVIVPLYRGGCYLRRCVDAVLTQTYENIELILVEDGTPDNERAICEQYEKTDSRVKVIYQENAGVSVARNMGLSIATGDYVVFCDIDDRLEPEWLETLYGRLIETGADVVSASFAMVDDDDKVLETCHVNETDIAFVGEQERADFLVEKILNARKQPGKIGWEACTRLFKRSIIEEHHIRFCETCGNFAEDLGFVLEYSLYYERVASIDYAGYRYTQHDGSMMGISGAVPRLDSMNEVSHQFLSRIEDDGDEVLAGLSPIFHYLIMRNQYDKNGLFNSWIELVNDAVSEISNRKWYEEETSALKDCQEQLKRYVGVEDTKHALILSDYCLDGNRKRYLIRCFLSLRSARKYFVRGAAHKVLGSERYEKLTERLR